MTSTNLDVTALFPSPAEPVVRPGEAIGAPSRSAAVTGPSGDLKATETVNQIGEASLETLGEQLEKLNAELQSFGIEFEISEEDQRLVTRVVDRESGELIRQIPSEEVLRMARSLDKSNGLLLKTTA